MAMARKHSQREESFSRLQTRILDKVKAGEPILSDLSWNYFWTADCVEEELLKHVGLFSSGTAGVPVFRTEDHVAGRPFIFTLADYLLLELLRHPLNHHLWRALRAALIYGLYGYSRGGRNGVFRQRPTDKKMTRTTWKLAEDIREQITNDLELEGEKDWGALTPFKVVSHNPGGGRYVGLMRTDGRLEVPPNVKEHTRGIILGLASY